MSPSISQRENNAGVSREPIRVYKMPRGVGVGWIRYLHRNTLGLIQSHRYSVKRTDEL